MSGENCKDCTQIEKILDKMETVMDIQSKQADIIEEHGKDITKFKIYQNVNGVQYEQIIKSITKIEMVQDSIQIAVSDLKDKPDRFKLFLENMALELLRFAVIGGLLYAASKGLF